MADDLDGGVEYKSDQVQPTSDHKFQSKRHTRKLPAPLTDPTSFI